MLNKKVTIPSCFSSDSRIIYVSRSNQIFNSVILYGSNMHNEVKHSQTCPTIAQLLSPNCKKRIKEESGGGPRVVVSTAAFHARVRGSVPGLGGLKETKNVSSPSTCESQYCGEPP